MAAFRSGGPAKAGHYVLTSQIEHIYVDAGGVRLHVARAGEGLPIVLLHGFPENWRSWRHQFAPLVEAGFSVWAPDLRGYNLSDKPRGVEAYHLRHLVADVAAIVDATGFPKAHVAGHDWGGGVAWTFAGVHPEKLDKLVILNAPHGKLYLERVRRPPQLFKSLYVLLFVTPWVAERALSAWNFLAVRDMFKRYPARKGAFSDEEIEEYVRAIAQPGALTSALNYYRANLAGDARWLGSSAYVTADTLVIWGERDPALSTVLLDGLERVAPRVRLHRIPGASHWVQNEAPDEVNRVMTEFLRGEPRQT